MKRQNASVGKKTARALLTLTVAGSLPATGIGGEGKSQERPAVEQKGFYCNVNALTASQRARHLELTKKLVEKRQQIVEMEKGYEFQFRPEDVSIAELAEWTMLESKCCPFFDFHIDLENEGKLACLRLTGAEGVKAFIRSEFHASEPDGK